MKKFTYFSTYIGAFLKVFFLGGGVMALLAPLGSPTGYNRDVKGFSLI